MVGVLIGRLPCWSCGRFVSDNMIRNVKLTNQPTDHATEQSIKQTNQTNKQINWIIGLQLEAR